ncbi:MAG TPA: substrate-binding domain-containing protein [Usitatibacter sp.]|nr:substrate-binding domain-containing protein [Usitatibacter sp.]
MIRIDIRPVWRFHSGTQREFDFQLIAVLAELDASQKLTLAAESAGISYRHAWNIVADWEAFFGAPLVTKAKGRGTRLTPLGKRLLWAGQRAQARLAPELENLAAEFADALNESLTEQVPSLVVHASHDFAIAGLRDMSASSRAAIGLQYKGSFDALASLRRGECDLAGFHLPEGPLGTLMAQRYAECLPAGGFRLIRFVTRAQGLIVRPGNPKAIREVGDLCRADVRMINRQRGSGTRALLEFLISSHGLDRSKMHGYEIEEITHGAVAALIAGNQADVGFGVQAAAAQYRLDFLPLCRERYLLACRAEERASKPVRDLVTTLKGAEFRAMVKALPGYDASDSGEAYEELVPATAHPGP